MNCDELRCCGSMINSCSTSGTSCVNNPAQFNQATPCTTIYIYICVCANISSLVNIFVGNENLLI